MTFVVVSYVHLGCIIGQVTALAVIKSLGVVLPYGAGHANSTTGLLLGLTDTGMFRGAVSSTAVSRAAGTSAGQQ